MHFLTGDGMVEPDFGGMEHEAGALGAVELVAHNGTAKSVGMGAVDAQLVGAARLGVEGDQVRGERREEGGGRFVDELVVGDSPLAVLHVDNLSGTVHGVGTQRKGDGARPTHDPFRAG